MEQVYATFDPPAVLTVLERTTKEGVIAGMLAGGVMVFVWNKALSKLGGVFSIYELMPSFIISCIFIVVVSLLTKEPSKEIVDEFERVKNYAEE